MKTSATFTTLNGTTIDFNRFIDGISAAVGKLVSSGFLTRWEAEDVKQDAAEKAWRYLNRFDEHLASAEAYGAIIGRSCALSAARRKRYSTVSLSDLISMEDNEAYGEQVILGSYSGNEYDADNELLAGEQYEALGKGMDMLTPVDCSIAVLTGDGFKPSEIAHELGLTANAVSTRLCKLRKVLRKEYNAYMAA